MSNTVYTKVMTAIAEGEKVTQAELAEATAFAKAKKRKQPKGALVKRTYTVQKGTDCSVAECGKPAKSRGMCMTHYVAEYRKDPVKMEKAREASRRYAAKQRAAKAELKALEAKALENA